MFKKYYCVRQQGKKDCGAACLATVLKQYCINFSMDEIKETAGTDESGTNAYGLVKAAKQFGFDAKCVRGDREAFFTDFPLPCIAHVTVKSYAQHYVVIHKIGRKRITIADPSRGIIRLSFDDFFGKAKLFGRTSRYKWSGILIMLYRME